MRKGLALVLGFFSLTAGLALAGEAKGPIVAFTLAPPRSDPAPTRFVLAPWVGEREGRRPLNGVGDLDISNTATGVGALMSNTTGLGNTATGQASLAYNTEGSSNTATGSASMYSNTSGVENTAGGRQALYSNTEGTANTADGVYSLFHNISGSYNTGIGGCALSMTTGNRNTALGFDAGYYSTSGSDNIFIGAEVVGEAADTNTLRLGRSFTGSLGQNKAFIAGIFEHPFAPTEAEVPSVVGILSTGQLGTVPAELLPTGPPGPEGPAGPAGPGLVSGSLLFLRAGIAPPPGYVLLGTQTIVYRTPSGRIATLGINIFQKL